jgi:hypothetical protein
MNDRTGDDARRYREAKRWPTVLLWVGSVLLLAGLLTYQLLETAAGLIVLGVGGYWMQHILHSGKKGP